MSRTRWLQRPVTHGCRLRHGAWCVVQVLSVFRIGPLGTACLWHSADSEYDDRIIESCHRLNRDLGDRRCCLTTASGHLQRRIIRRLVAWQCKVPACCSPPITNDRCSPATGIACSRQSPSVLTRKRRYMITRADYPPVCKLRKEHHSTSSIRLVCPHNHVYSAPTCSPFSATERFMSSTRTIKPNARTPNSQKTSK